MIENDFRPSVDQFFWYCNYKHWAYSHLQMTTIASIVMTINVIALISDLLCLMKLLQPSFKWRSVFPSIIQEKHVDCFFNKKNWLRYYLTILFSNKAELTSTQGHTTQSNCGQELELEICKLCLLMNPVQWIQEEVWPRKHKGLWH